MLLIQCDLNCEETGALPDGDSGCSTHGRISSLPMGWSSITMLIEDKAGPEVKGGSKLSVTFVACPQHGVPRPDDLTIERARKRMDTRRHPLGGPWSPEDGGVYQG